MDVYKVVVSKSAEKELLKLPAPLVKRIVPVLESLSNDPRPEGCKKLKGFVDLWRVRVGNYRIIYAIEDVIRLVEVQAIGHRKDIYE